jgi:carbonic anhydrase
MRYLFIILTLLIIFFFVQFSINKNKDQGTKSVTTKEELLNMTPEEGIELLKLGNQKFVSNHTYENNHIDLVQDSQHSQHPFAIVVTCIDSRLPPEIVFSQSIGNIFVTRVAAGVLSDDVIAGIEYATQVVGTKVILVLGHESCGAVKAASKDVKLGSITQLLEKIKPAVLQVKQEDPSIKHDSQEYVDLIAKHNAHNIADEIPERSPLIKKSLEEGKIKIVSGMYHTDSGEVEFLD